MEERKIFNSTEVDDIFQTFQVAPLFAETLFVIARATKSTFREIFDQWKEMGLKDGHMETFEKACSFLEEKFPQAGK